MAVLVLTALFAVSVFADETAVDLSSNRLFKSYPAIWKAVGTQQRGPHYTTAVAWKGERDILVGGGYGQLLERGAENGTTGGAALKTTDGRGVFFTYYVSEENTINIEDFPYFVVAASSRPGTWIGADTYKALLAAQEIGTSFATPQMRVVIKLFDDDTVYEWFCNYNNYGGNWHINKHTAVINVTEKYPEISGTVEHIQVYPIWSNVPCEYDDANGENWAAIEAYYAATDKTGLTAPEHVWANLKNSAGEVEQVDMKSYFDSSRQATIYMSDCNLGGFAFIPVEAAASSCATAMSTTANAKNMVEDSYYTLTKADPNTLDEYFTLALIPELTGISNNADALNGIANWIVANEDDKNIKYTVQLGDIFARTSQNYITSGANLNTNFPQGDGKTAFAAYTIPWPTYYNNTFKEHHFPFAYYASLGKVLLNGKYDTTISAPLANFRAAMDILKAANVPYAVNPTQVDHLGMQARNLSYLSSVFSYDDFAHDGKFAVETVAALNKTALAPIVAADSTSTTPLAIVAKNGYFDANDLLDKVTGISNIYYTFEANGEKYIVINLESTPRATGTNYNLAAATPVQWANDLLAQYSDHKAIVITERFVKSSGDLLTCWSLEYHKSGKIIYDSNARSLKNALANNTVVDRQNATGWYNEAQTAKVLPVFGDELWRTALQKHDNLIMVVCSNSGYDASGFNGGLSNVDTEIEHSTITGVNGNTVQVVRADMSGTVTGDTNGLVLLRFAPDGAIDTAFVSPSDSFYSHHNVIDAPAAYSVTGAEGVNGVDATAVGGEKVTITPTVAEGENAVAVVLEYTLNTTYYDGTYIADPKTTIYTSTYNPTYEKVVSGNGSFTFEMPYANVTVKEVITVAEDEVKIALSSTSMRIDGTPGMRFLASVYAGESDAARNYEYGIVMVPAKIIDDYGYDVETEFVFEGDTFVVEEALIIPMVNKYSYSSSRFTYTGVLTGIPEAAYGADIMVMAYVKTGEGTYEYSNILVRSASDIANMAFFSGNESKANETTLKSYMVD